MFDSSVQDKATED